MKISVPDEMETSIADAVLRRTGVVVFGIGEIEGDVVAGGPAQFSFWYVKPGSDEAVLHCATVCEFPCSMDDVPLILADAVSVSVEGECVARGTH